jgi:hypothetical protein
MKKNSIRLSKLEASLIKGEPEIFEISYFELLERIEEREFKQGRKPTQKFLDIKKTANKTRPTLTPKLYQRLKAEQAERNAQIEAMSEQEIDDRLNRLLTSRENEGTFEEMKIEA